MASPHRIRLRDPWTLERAHEGEISFSRRFHAPPRLDQPMKILLAVKLADSIILDDSGTQKGCQVAAFLDDVALPPFDSEDPDLFAFRLPDRLSTSHRLSIVFKPKPTFSNHDSLNDIWNFAQSIELQFFEL